MVVDEIGAARIGRTTDRPPHLLFVAEFGGKAVEELSSPAKLSADVSHGAGVDIVAYNLIKNEFDHTWRVTIEIAPPHQAANLRAHLTRGERAVTESWNYTWQP